MDPREGKEKGKGGKEGMKECLESQAGFEGYNTLNTTLERKHRVRSRKGEFQKMQKDREG